MSNDKPIFEVRVGDDIADTASCRVYRIWPDGRTEGFREGEKAVFVKNGIPKALREAKKK